MHVVSSVNRWSAANGLMSFLLSRYTGRILHLSGKVCYVCDHFYKRPYDLFISIHMLGHFWNTESNKFAEVHVEERFSSTMPSGSQLNDPSCLWTALYC